MVIESRRHFYWLDAAKVIAAFCVVLLHVCAYFLDFSSVNDFNSWFVAAGYNSFTRFSVPLFVMVSGYLLLAENRIESISVFYKKRFSKILLPIVFWSLFFLLWTTIKFSLRGDAYSLEDLLLLVVKGRPYSHMWYMYMLIGLYMLSPFLKRLVCVLEKQQLIVLIIILFFISMSNYLYRLWFQVERTFFLTWAFDYLPYFIFGHYLSRYNIKVHSGSLLFLYLVCCIGSWLLASLWFKCYKVESSFFWGYFSPFVVICSLSIIVLIKRIFVLESKFFQKISPLTLGVYLIHPIFIDLLKYLKVSEVSSSYLIYILLCSFFVFILSAVVTKILLLLPFFRKVV